MIINTCMKYEYYYNDIPNVGLCRNNLIYTSLMSQDKKTFVQWYHNDSEYHRGQNQVVDPDKMEEKWEREVKFLKIMHESFPMHIPFILDIDYTEKKIYLQVDGLDFWNRAGCLTENYDKVLPNWQEQMLEIIRAHRSLGIYKISMHPSSYFIVDSKLKSINYFFAHHESEQPFSLKSVESHIYSDRQTEVKKNLAKIGVDWDSPISFESLNQLCWESFKNNYPLDFIEKAKSI